MGQYYLVINKTKKEYLHPHEFGSGLKACEFLSDGRVTQGLGLLLIKTDASGGGDLSSESNLIGSWAGDEIYIVGDYDSSNLYDFASKEYKDVSADVIEALQDDDIIGEFRKW
jgi:hypothetical protein